MRACLVAATVAHVASFPLLVSVLGPDGGRPIARKSPQHEVASRNFALLWSVPCASAVLLAAVVASPGAPRPVLLAVAAFAAALVPAAYSCAQLHSLLSDSPRFAAWLVYCCGALMLCVVCATALVTTS